MWLWRVQIQSRIIIFCPVQSMSDLENGIYGYSDIYFLPALHRFSYRNR